MRRASKTAGIVSAAAQATAQTAAGFRPVIGDLTSIAYSMMDGIAYAMDNRSYALYAKAQAIANNIAATMRTALDVHSPSRVMQKLFGFVMEGAYEGLESGEDKLYQKGDYIARTLADRLAIQQQEIPDLYAKLNLLTEASPVNVETVRRYTGAAYSTPDSHYESHTAQPPS